MTIIFRRFVRAGVIGIAVGLVSACGGGNSATIAQISSYPPMANDNPPGASPLAISTAKALGRGVNFGNMFDAPTEGAWGLRLESDFFAKAKAGGFSSVRLPVRWSNHADAKAPFLIDAGFADRVEAAVDQGLNTGFYLMLNMHHYRQLDGDTLDAGERRVDDAILEERFLAMWEQIAQRYKDKSDKLVFEIYNEPHGRQTSDKWNDLVARAVNVIRKSNPTRPIVIGPIQWNNAKELRNLRLPNDANLIATVHNYEPFKFTHQGAEWASPPMPTGITCCTTEQKNQIIDPLETASAWASAKRYPVYLGEFGAYSKADMASRVTFTRIMRDEAELRDISWGYWEFASSFGVYDPISKTWRSELKDALLGK
ncbi:MAG: glycoside hydrolase family 5 protein [Pseudomonadota bacterium]